MTLQDCIDTHYLRPTKAACLQAAWNNYEDRSDHLALSRLGTVTLRAMGQVPGITPSPDRLIDDCDFYAERVNDPAATPIAGTALYAGYMRKSWGHFLMNSTARLWPLLYEPDTPFDKIVFFAEDAEAAPPSGNFRQFLSLLGILDKCVVLPPATYRFEDLTVGDIALENGIYYSREFLLPFHAVRRAAMAGDTMPSDIPKGIILTRSRWQRNDKLQINIRSIEDLFINAGYTPLSPESLPLSDLIRNMHQAPEVVTFSGSTAHNILFCPDKPLIILERAAANNGYQAGIMKLMRSHTVPVDCFYQPLLTSSTDNLTIYGATAQLTSYAAHRGMAMPSFPLRPTAEFRRYLRVYRRHYGHGPGINSWETGEAPAIYEAYFASRPRYEACIDRRRPVLPTDFLSPRVLLRYLRYLRYLRDRLHH